MVRVVNYSQSSVLRRCHRRIPDSKVHGANMGPIWGRQDPGGPHVGPMNFANWDGCPSPSEVTMKNMGSNLLQMQTEMCTLLF